MKGKAPKQFWAGANSRCIEQRILVEADLKLLTPAHFGNGDGDEITDMPLLAAADDGRTPLLTGATLAGALRGYLRAHEAGYRAHQPDSDKQWAASRESLTGILFGAFKGDDEGEQSALIIEDAYGRDFAIEIRDGVKINPKSRTAEGQALFNMHVWQPGTTFPLRIELLMMRPRHKKDESKVAYQERITEYQENLERAFITALQGLEDGSITLGARKRRGFGRIGIEQWWVKTFNLADPKQLFDWIKNGGDDLNGQSGVQTGKNLRDLNLFKRIETAPDARHYFEMDASFKLDGSLLIRSTGYEPVSPDMVHLHSWDTETGAMKPTLPGTSVAGALRARAARILKMIRPQRDGEKDEAWQKRIGEWLETLFGSSWKPGQEKEMTPAERERVKKKRRASRLTVEEHIIEDATHDLVQNRVAIDRFTGGAREAALFDEQPAFGADKTRLRIKLRLIKPAVTDTKPQAQKKADQTFQAQIGLLLLLLKDLWTGDLPLGGESSVGRGRLQGRAATCTYKNGADEPQTWSIRRNGEGLVVDDAARQALEKFVAALHEEAI